MKAASKVAVNLVVSSHLGLLERACVCGNKDHVISCSPYSFLSGDSSRLVGANWLSLNFHYFR